MPLSVDLGLCGTPSLTPSRPRGKGAMPAGDGAFCSPTFFMWQIVVVPEASAFVRGLDPRGLFGGFGVPVAENHVGAAIVPVADAGLVEIRNDVGKNKIEDVLRVWRPTEIKQCRAIAEGNHFRGINNAALRHWIKSQARTFEITTKSRIEGRRVHTRCPTKVVTVVRKYDRVSGMKNVEIFLRGPF